MKHSFATLLAPVVAPSLLLTLLCAAVAQAGDYYIEVPALPTVKIKEGGEGATKVETVFGKEYSHTDFTAVLDPRISNVDDHDAFGIGDAGQVVLWDGMPGPSGGNSGSVDGFDFETALFPFNVDLPQVDALANDGDFLLRQILRNEATLLFSMTGDMAPGGAPKSRVHFEDPDPVDLVADPLDVWANIETPAGPGAGVNHHPVMDVDALEIWGPEPPSHNNEDTPVREGYVGGGPGVGTPVADANRFSLDVDSATGTSVWAYDIDTGVVAPWISHMAIVEAVEDLFLGPGADYDQQTRDMIDVDGTMARDQGDSSPTAAFWDAGDGLLFTIDPIDEPVAFDVTGAPIAAAGIDGGEIMYLEKTATGFTIEFLDHGGHKWDTAFDVSGTFGYEFEDVDALEAVGVIEGTDISTPEPSTVIMCGLALVMVGGYRFRPQA